ncbi:hypothetical protein FACS18948_2820 [Clostridia bacterium]|nr:hypothetical protein FACS18948_2820 [Clostridia bacterium]
MIKALKSLRGNPRACVWTEPIWAIPYNLYVPYVSVYMVALGLSQIDLGLISTLGMISQVVFSLLGGVITDKLGRRNTTFIFDLLGWTVPMLLWAFAQNFIWFALAALFNGVYRITQTSWTCLATEDLESDKLVTMYTFLDIAGLVSGFFAPITFFILKSNALIPTVRALYMFSFVTMTAKFFILNKYCTETRMGVRRMEETRGTSMIKELADYGKIIKLMLNNKGTLLTIALWTFTTIAKTAYDTFFPIIATERIGVADASLALISTFKLIITLVCQITFVARIKTDKYKLPLTISFFGLMLARVTLAFLGQGASIGLFIIVALDAVAFAAVTPLQGALQIMYTDAHERARVMSVFQAMILLVSAPFGAIAGILSQANRSYPLIMCTVAYLCAMAATLLLSKQKPAEEVQQEV